MGLEFLTRTGQISSDVRHEFILLSDILGLSTLMDAMENAKPRGGESSTRTSGMIAVESSLLTTRLPLVSQQLKRPYWALFTPKMPTSCPLEVTSYPKSQPARLSH